MKHARVVRDNRTQYANPIRFVPGEAGDGRAETLRDYSAQELDVDTGDEVVLEYELGGWCWCKHADGRCGWVPTEHLERA